MSNSTHVAFALVPHHHPILVMHSMQSISVQAVQIMDNVYVFNAATATKYPVPALALIIICEYVHSTCSE